MKVKKITVYLIMALVICLNINCVCNADDIHDVGDTQEFTDSEGNKYKLWTIDGYFYISADKSDVILKEVIIPDNLKNGFINDTRAEKIFIPAAAENITFAFNAADEMIIDDNNENYRSVDGVVYSKDNKELVGYPRYKKDEIYKAPDSVEKVNVEWFLREPEYLKGFIIPKSLKKLNLACLSKDVNLYIPSEVNCISEEDWNAYFDNYASNIDSDEPKVVYTETDSPYIDMFNSNSTCLPVTGDENYNLRHAAMALKMSLGIYDTQTDLREYANTGNSRLLFDENGDGKVELDDAKVVLCKALGIKSY